MKKYCPECGNEVTEESKFCPKCGADLTNAIEVEESPKEEETEQPISKEQFKKNLIKDLILGVIIIIAIIIVATTVSHHRIVNAVKQSTNTAYDTEAVFSVVFGYYFDDAKFKYTGKNNGYNVVTFSGECYYDNEETEITFDINFDKSDGTSFFSNLTMDGESYNDLMLGLVLMDVYETYMEEFEYGYY